MVMENVIGIKSDKLKLSDFIDESFFEDIEMTGKDQIASGILKDADKSPIDDLMK